MCGIHVDIRNKYDSKLIYIYGLDEKTGFESQARHQNEIRKILLRRFPLSKFLAKNSVSK